MEKFKYFFVCFMIKHHKMLQKQIIEIIEDGVKADLSKDEINQQVQTYFSNQENATFLDD